MPAACQPTTPEWCSDTTPEWFRNTTPESSGDADGAEADHAMCLDGRPAGMAGIAGQNQRVREERAALQDLVGARLRSGRVPPRRHAVVIAGIPVLAPLHDVASHVEGA